MCKPRLTQIAALNTNLAAVSLHQSRLTPLLARYHTLLHLYGKRTNRYSFSFHTLRLIITIGSLIVPALLSIQNNTTHSEEVYWVVWVLSLLVTMSNGVMTLLKVDKKYFLLHTVFQQLMSEGWQYIHLSGKYSGHKTPGTPPTHENQYPFFTHAIEKIRMKHVEEEYYRITDMNSTQVNQPQTDPLVPPTPLRNPLLQVNDGTGATGATTLIRRQPPFLQTSNTQSQGQGQGTSGQGTQNLTAIEEAAEGST